MKTDFCFFFLFAQRIEIVFEKHLLVIHVSDDPSFPHIFYEVFAAQEYRVRTQGTPSLILDIGANVGLTSLFFACLYPQATIYAFEPCTENFKFLEQNTAPFPNIHPIQMGVFSHSGTQRIYLQRGGGLNSMLRTSTSFEDIRTTTLDAFLAERKIVHVDLVKIDTEGAEEDILAATKSLDAIDAIVGELHLDLINKNRVLSILDKHFTVSDRVTDSQGAVFFAQNRRVSPRPSH